MTQPEPFELANVGAGPDPFSLAALPDGTAFVLLLLQRDHYCTNCRDQVQAVADRYDEFDTRNTVVVSIVPEPAEQLTVWQERYDLPFPLLADPDASVGGAYDQPVRFGFLGSWSDFLGRMPKAVLLDCRAGDPTPVYAYEGSSTWDRPTIDALLTAIDEHR